MAHAKLVLKPIITGKVSGGGDGAGGLAQVGTGQFGADGGEGFFGGADEAVVGVEGALVKREAGEKLAAVEIVLREGREPEAGSGFVTLLHEMAAFVDFGEEEADGNVVGDFAFDAGELAGGFVDPDGAVDFGEEGGGAGGGFEGGVGEHGVFEEGASGARLGAEIGEEKSVAGGVEEVVAVFLFLGDFGVGFALRTAVFCGPGEGLFELE